MCENFFAWLLVYIILGLIFSLFCILINGDILLDRKHITGYILWPVSLVIDIVVFLRWFIKFLYKGIIELIK